MKENLSICGQTSTDPMPALTRYLTNGQLCRCKGAKQMLKHWEGCTDACTTCGPARRYLAKSKEIGISAEEAAKAGKKKK